MFLFNVLDTLLQIYFYIVIIRALISWFNPDPRNKLYQLLYDITEPLLVRIRRLLPDMGGIDLSPIVLILGIQFIVRGILLRMLFGGF